MLVRVHDAGRCYRGYVSVYQWDPIAENTCSSPLLGDMYVRHAIPIPHGGLECVKMVYEARSPLTAIQLGMPLTRQLKASGIRSVSFDTNLGASRNGCIEAREKKNSLCIHATVSHRLLDSMP